MAPALSAARMARVAAHIASGIDGDQRADERHRHQHERCECVRLKGEIDLDVADREKGVVARGRLVKAARDGMALEPLRPALFPGALHVFSLPAFAARRGEALRTARGG